MEHLSISHFRDIYSENVEKLKSLCQEWENIHADISVPEDVRDEIWTTIGLTNLLLNQKLKQFNGLIDDSEFKRGEKEISCLDLQGFWDMVYNEVEKIQKSFFNLEKCKANNWTFVQETVSRVEPKKKLIPALSKASVAAKHHASAARQRLAEVKLKMRAQMALQRKDTLKRENTTENKDNLISKVVGRGTPKKLKVDVIKNDEVPVELKSAVSNITNVHISEQKEQPGKVHTPSKKKIQPKKLSSRNKAIKTLHKENILPHSTSEPENKSSKPSGRKERKKAKESIPLQCITRSAKKAMLAKRSGL